MSNGQQPQDALESLICAVLRGEAIAWPLAAAADGTARLLKAARYHGVLPLLNSFVPEAKGQAAWPALVRQACRDEARNEAMHELARRQEIPRLLDGLATAGLKPLILKGGALAYSHYPTAALRPRGDTDILVPVDSMPTVAAVLARLHYERDQGTTGLLISYQATWTHVDRLGMTHGLDVHWRINNSQILANILNYAGLEKRAVPVPTLGPQAYGLAPVDALVLACIHRAGHANAPYYVDGEAYFGGDRLIWLYDIHLLVKAMSRAELEDFVALAASKRIKAICLDALSRSIQCFDTPTPADILAALELSGPIEPSARYLSGGRMRQMLGDFLALDDWGDRVRWVRETALPSADYMRAKYPEAPNAWLPWLYARRALGWLRKARSSRPGHEH